MPAAQDTPAAGLPVPTSGSPHTRAFSALHACQDCDLLQRETPLLPGTRARCGRCGAELYRQHGDGLDRSLAFTLTGLVLLLVANAYPIVGLQVGSDLVQSTLLGAVKTLFAQQMRLVAALVLLTTVITPALQLLALAWLLLPLKLGFVPPQLNRVFRLLQRANEWSMVEVFMLGLLVALVKLSHIAAVVPGTALWSFGALMLALVAAISSFDARAMWARREALR